MAIQKPRGTADILPSEVYKWHYVEDMFKQICAEYGFKEIRTPVFENTKLFKRGVGETTDIVQKEMFSVIPDLKVREVLNESLSLEGFDKYLNKKGLTLRPEGTAPTVRSFVENKLYGSGSMHKYYYIASCYRNERQQAGRLREFHQFGIETFGTKSPSVDAEVIALADTFIKRVGLDNVELHINSIGCKECRPVYDKALREYLKPKLETLCETCNDRYEKNPMRIIDCKNPSCQEQLQDAPKMIDYLCEDCQTHFDAVKLGLDKMNIPYIIDTNIVRGLDYYTKTAFEFISNDIGAQSTVSGGGRYDGLIEDIGGPSTPGVGFGMGIERLIMTLEANNVEIPKPQETELFILVLGDNVKYDALGLAKSLRDKGLLCEIDHIDRSLKAQFKYTNKLNVPYTIVLGEDEVNNKEASIKNMATGETTTFKFNELEKIVNTIKNNEVK